MLTRSEINLLPNMLLRSLACDCLALIKMRSLVPVEVEDKLMGYKTKIVEMVFDPDRVKTVNMKFEDAGFILPDRMKVIAVNEDGTILVWGGFNSIYWLKKRKRISKNTDANMAFQDLRDLTGRFKIKNTNIEIAEMSKRIDPEKLML